jgi:hypothetical protein
MQTVPGYIDIIQLVDLIEQYGNTDNVEGARKLRDQILYMQALADVYKDKLFAYMKQVSQDKRTVKFPEPEELAKDPYVERLNGFVKMELNDFFKEENIPMYTIHVQSHPERLTLQFRVNKDIHETAKKRSAIYTAITEVSDNRQKVDEAIPFVAGAGLFLLRAGTLGMTVLRPAIIAGKWLWKNPGKTTAITVGADVVVNDGQDTKEVVDMVVDGVNTLKDKGEDVISPEETKTVIQQIVEFVKANPGKSAVGFLVAFIAGSYALRAWFRKNDQYTEEDVDKVLRHQQKVLSKNPV